VFVPIGYVLALLHSVNLRWLSILPGALLLFDYCFRYGRACIFQRAQIAEVADFRDNINNVDLVMLKLSLGGFIFKAGQFVDINIPAISVRLLC